MNNLKELSELAWQGELDTKFEHHPVHTFYEGSTELAENLLGLKGIGGFYVVFTLLLPAAFYSQVKGMVQIFTRKAGFIRHLLDILAFVTLWVLYLPLLVIFKTPLQQRLAVAVCKLGICGELIADYTKYCQAVCLLNLVIVLIYAGRYFTPLAEAAAPRAAEHGKKD